MLFLTILALYSEARQKSRLIIIAIFGAILLISWLVRFAKRRSAIRNRSIVGLLISRCDYARRNGKDDDPNNLILNQTPDSVCCDTDDGLYEAAQTDGVQTLTRFNAAMIDCNDKPFIDDLFAKHDQWPAGIGYTVAADQAGHYLVNITAVVNIDYKNSAMADLEAYIDYLRRLGYELTREYNLWRAPRQNQPLPQQATYSIQ